MLNNSELPFQDMSSGVVRLQKINDGKKSMSRMLRKQATPAEKVLWFHLRNRKFENLKFRRQQIIDGFITDFFCEELKLALELDGLVHNIDVQKEIDIHREHVFRSRGIRTLRFRNEEIFNNIDWCLDKIKEMIKS